MTVDREAVDPALDAMLRDHAAETPPAHIDAAILAAAHRAVESTPRARSRRHWRLWLPLAAAATVTAVVIGLQGVERQAPEVAPSANGPLKAPRDEAAASAPPALTQASPSAREAPRAAAPAQPAREAGVTSAQISQDARIADTIERIRTLRRDGREAEAEAALARLREMVSDADSRLPPDLRAWASSVRR